MNDADTTLEWDKEGDGVRQVRASLELNDPTVNLTNPVVTVEKRTGSTTPEDWNTVSEPVISNVIVVDALDDDGVLIATNQAIQLQLNKDLDPQPDNTDPPIPGIEYRLVLIADRSDVGQWVGKPFLTIHP